MDTTTPRGEVNGALRPQIDRSVFTLTVVLLVGASVPLLLWPESGTEIIDRLFAGVTETLGVVYVWAAVATIGFLGWLAFGRHAHYRIGGADATTDFPMFAWASMLFCAGIGTGVVYWGTIEWAYYLESPPFDAEPRSPEATAWAAAYPIFHWGPLGWALYCLPAVALSVSYYRGGVGSLRLSDNLRPVLGTRADGVLGRVVDMLFMTGLLGAAGTGVGLAVPLISAGVAELLGIADSNGLKLVVVVVVTGVFAASVYSGLEKGIQRLSVLNVRLTLLLLVFVLVVGPTLFILRMSTSTVGHLLQNTIAMSFWAQPQDPVGESGFFETWTVFYWAWWIALGPYMGMFVARISRGRTLREMVFGMLGYGSLGCAIFFMILGNYALKLELDGRLSVTEQLATEGAPTAIVAVVSSLPLGSLVLSIFCILSLVFMATSYDSAAYTLALGASKQLPIGTHPPRWHRMFWAFAVGLLPVALMFLGGLKPFQTASIVVSVPLLAVYGMMAIVVAKILRREAG